MANKNARIVWALLSRGGSYTGDPPLPGVITTGIRDEHALGPLNPKHIIIDQDLDRVSPELPVDIEAEVMQPNLTVLAHSPGALTEPEDALKAFPV